MKTTAAALALAGFDILSFANNHAMDYGAEAMLQARDLLATQSVAAIGAGENETAAHTPLIREINGIRLAFLAYVHVPVEASSGFDTADWTATADAPGIAWADPERIRQDVVAARQQADVVIVALHSGLEYIEAPGEAQTAAAHAAIEAGATTLNVPDTVGYALPDEMARLVATLIKKTKGGRRKDVVWSVHCHDDLGLAVANSLAAVASGARQVEVAVNGIGERAGNASLEEVAMAIRTRADLMRVTHQLDTRWIGDTSRRSEEHTSELQSH